VTESKSVKNRPYPREAILGGCLLLLTVMFGITGLASRLYRRKVHSLADEWLAKGEMASNSGQVSAALNDYRNALVYSPNNSLVQLRLAQALIADDRPDDASSYLLNLLADAPGNGEINLELARIAARKGETVDAVRYYEGSIYGVWDADPLVRRWEVRRELCEYLLNHGEVINAQPEIISLAQEALLGDLKQKQIAADLFLRADQWDRALNEDQSILKMDPRDQEALAGAGIAAFQLGRYPEALQYFNKLPNDKRDDPKIADMIEKARQIIAVNPYTEGLSVGERARITWTDLRQAMARTADCERQHKESPSDMPSVSNLQKLGVTSSSTAREWSELNLERYPDRIDSAMALVFSMEDTGAQLCGAPQTASDHALLVVAHSRERAGQ
jgi:tetratricopeptide (TPR) repeat protein